MTSESINTTELSNVIASIKLDNATQNETDAEQQVESLLCTLKEEQVAKQVFIKQLEKKLSDYRKQLAGNNDYSLRKRTSELDAVLAEIDNRKYNLREKIAQCNSELKQHAFREAQIAKQIFLLEKEHKNEVLADKQLSLQKLHQRQFDLETEIIMKEAQLEAILNEKKRRDNVDIDNLQNLLKKADLIKFEIENGSYDHQYKLILSKMITNADSSKNVTTNLGIELIEKRMTRMHDELGKIDDTIADLRRQKLDIYDKIEIQVEKRKQLQEKLNQGHFSNVKTELDDLSRRFHKKDIANTHLQLNNVLMIDITSYLQSKTCKEIIEFVKHDVEMLPQKINWLKRLKLRLYHLIAFRIAYTV